MGSPYKRIAGIFACTDSGFNRYNSNAILTSYLMARSSGAPHLVKLRPNVDVCSLYDSEIAVECGGTDKSQRLCSILVVTQFSESLAQTAFVAPESEQLASLNPVAVVIWLRMPAFGRCTPTLAVAQEMHLC